jgi:hypothetical protein
VLDLVAAASGVAATVESGQAAGLMRVGLGDAGELLDHRARDAIRHGMARIGEHHPQLGEHLDGAVRTGTYCAYLPGPRAPAGWTF